MGADAVVRGAEWLCGIQNDDGGWGELPQSYDDVTYKGKGPSTASQTAWALLGLMAAGYRDSEAVSGGLRYLLDHQKPDGSWDEELWTGTGFPSVFYLRYHLYSIYFPLLAFAEYTNSSPRPRRKLTVTTSRPARPRAGAHPA